jgi:hypothetical protein
LSRHSHWQQYCLQSDRCHKHPPDKACKLHLGDGLARGAMPSRPSVIYLQSGT